MNYTVSDLRNKNVHTQKATLQRNGITLDLIVRPGEQPTEQMIEHADNISLVDVHGVVVAKTKSIDGKTFDNRNKPAQG